MVTAAVPSIAVPMLIAAAPSTADPLMSMDGVAPSVMATDEVAPSVSATVMTTDEVAPSVSATVMVTGEVVPSVSAPVVAMDRVVAPSVSAPVMATDEVASPSVSAPVLENTDGTAEPDDDPDAVDLAEQSEEDMEGNDEEDNGFDVVENITSDAYQQQRQECEATKLQLIESSWSVTCKSGSNELKWTAIHDSIAECPPVEYPKVGIRDMDWRKFDHLASYAKSSLKKESSSERPYHFLESLLLLWPGDWKKQLSQLNAAIITEYRNKAKHKHSVHQVKPVSANKNFIFIGNIILSGAIGKGGRLLFEKESSRLKDGTF